MYAALESQAVNESQRTEHLIDLVGGSDIPGINEFVSHKDNCNVVLGWMSIDKLAELTSNPDFIKEMVNEMDASPQHVITRA